MHWGQSRDQGGHGAGLGAASGRPREPPAVTQSGTGRGQAPGDGARAVKGGEGGTGPTLRPGLPTWGRPWCWGWWVREPDPQGEVGARKGTQARAGGGGQGDPRPCISWKADPLWGHSRVQDRACQNPACGSLSRSSELMETPLTLSPASHIFTVIGFYKKA